MERFGHRVAVVTGSDSGIGRATSLRFAREGARVVVVDIVDAGNTASLNLPGMKV